MAGQLGLEPSLNAYIADMADVFELIRLVVKDTGTVWLNLGDSYVAQRKGPGGRDKSTLSAPDAPKRAHTDTFFVRYSRRSWLRRKNLIGLPWRMAFALQARGWILRDCIIWCLSGGVRVYARTQKGESSMTIKDLVRLDPSTVQLWNGEKWTQVTGWSKAPTRHGALEIQLASGERIGCTPEHRWPTQRGNIRADQLKKGDVISKTQLPEPEVPYNATHLTDMDVALMIGLYLAEGSQDSKGRLQFAGHKDENERRRRIFLEVTEKFGGTVRAYNHKGNTGNVVVDCPPLTAVIRQYIHGNTAKNKGLRSRVWKHNNYWLDWLLRGYLQGDGCWDKKNNRWRLTFTRNDKLADDIRTLAARLGLRLRLAPGKAKGFGKEWPIYRGEIRNRSYRHASKRKDGKVTAIRNSNARQFWDIGVADEPHLFALASGILTHNSKPNPLPESVKDRCTKAHEYLFMLTKGPKYYYDNDAIAELRVTDSNKPVGGWQYGEGPHDAVDHNRPGPGQNKYTYKDAQRHPAGERRNRRSVWTIPTEPYKDGHFATFPTGLVAPCILAGTPPGGIVLDPFMGTGTVAAAAKALGRHWLGIELNEAEYRPLIEKRLAETELGMEF